MTSVDWERVEPVLERLLDLPADEHTAFLARECGGDRHLEQRLLGLVARARGTRFLEPPPSILSSAPAGALVGPYRLVRQVGSGGMGEVWLAERADGTFDKQVAIKLVQRGLATDELMRRFETERQVLAWLEHPGIARLVDGGVREDGRPYLVMEYVDGVPIDRFCVGHGLSVPQRIEHFLDVGDAVQHAHERGVVHRDLKPANVLVDASGRSRLLDFGIAKVLGVEDEREALELTRTGQRLFSPLYASPEQVRGEAVTAATDVYSLGVMLCELLTDRRPYDARTTSQLELERVVCETRPARPSDLVHTSAERRALRGDLDWIVGTALRKEPERRYASVRALCDDLRRHLAGERVLARPDSLAYRARTYARRNRALVAGVAALFAGLTASLVLWRASVRSERESRQVAYASALQAAEAAIRAGQIQVAEGQLDGAPPSLRGWEWRHLRSRLDRSEPYLVTTPTVLPGGLAISTDRELLAVRDPSTLALWSRDRGELVRSRRLLVGSAEADVARSPATVSFHPSGDRLAVACSDGSVLVLSVDSLETLDVLEAGDGQFYGVVYDPRGRWLVCGLWSGEVVVFDHPGGGEVARWAAHGKGHLQLRFDSAGERLVTCSWDEKTRVWSVPGFDLERELGGHTRGVTDAAFAAGGELLVTTSLDGTARVWTLDAEAPPQVFRGHGTAVEGLALARDGETVFTSGSNGTILRWSLRTLEVLGVLHGHRVGVGPLLCEPEGRLLSGDRETGLVRRWRADTDDVTVLPGCEFQRSIALDPAGNELAVAGPDGRIRRWSSPGLAPLDSIVAGSSPVMTVAYSTKGPSLLACTEDGWVRSWSIPGGRLQSEQHAGPGLFHYAEFDPAGAWAVTGSTDRAVGGFEYRRVDLANRTSPSEPVRIRSGRHDGRAMDSSGTNVFVSGGPDGVVRRFDVSSWEPRVEIETEAITGLAVDSDERRILVGHAGSASLWSAGRRRWVVDGLGGEVFTAAFHPSEPRIALGTTTGGVEIVDARTGRRLVRLSGHQWRVEDLAYTPDGERLLSCSMDGTVRVWSVQ